VAAAVWQQRLTAAVGHSQPEVANQRAARAFVRVCWSGALTFAVAGEVGASGRRVEGGHGFES
jgi:hypothetical protein